MNDIDAIKIEANTKSLIQYAKSWSTEQLAQLCQNCDEARGRHAFGSGFLCSDPIRCGGFE